MAHAAPEAVCLYRTFTSRHVRSRGVPDTPTTQGDATEPILAKARQR